MNKEEFKNYQRQLNSHRENLLKSQPKLEPVILLGDDDFDVSIGDIPISLKDVPAKVQQDKPNRPNKDSAVSLF